MDRLIPSLFVVLIFAALIAYEYIKDLRRELKAKKQEADTAWRLYESAERRVLQLTGKPLPTERFFPEDEKPNPSSAPFAPVGIGPTAINDRELRREIAEKEQRTPKFASPKVLIPTGVPSGSAIAEAARQAAAESNGE